MPAPVHQYRRQPTPHYIRSQESAPVWQNPRQTPEQRQLLREVVSVTPSCEAIRHSTNTGTSSRDIYLSRKFILAFMAVGTVVLFTAAALYAAYYQVNPHNNEIIRIQYFHQGMMGHYSNGRIEYTPKHGFPGYIEENVTFAQDLR